MDKKIPTTQTWIERVLEQSIDWDTDCLNPCFTIGELAEAIAQAHEEEIKLLKAGVKQAAYRLDQVHALKGRLAKMVLVLGEMDAIALGREKPTLGTHIRIREALQSAPKVLHHEEAKWDTVHLIWPVVRLKRPLMIDATLHDDIIPGVTFMGHDPERYGEFPGKDAVVIVLECSVNHASGTKSEQEESR